MKAWRPNFKLHRVPNDATVIQGCVFELSTLPGAYFENIDDHEVLRLRPVTLLFGAASNGLLSLQGSQRNKHQAAAS